MSKVLALVLGAGLIIIMSVLVFQMSENTRLSEWSVSSEGNSLALPVYPGAQVISKETKSYTWTKYSELAISFSTNDSTENVLDYYDDILLGNKFSKVTTRNPDTLIFVKDPDAMADPLGPSLHLSVTIELQKEEGKLAHIKIKLTINYPQF